MMKDEAGFAGASERKVHLEGSHISTTPEQTSANI